MPKQIEDIDRHFQLAGQQHPELFHDMRLWIKRRKTKQQCERDEKLVVEKVFHTCLVFQPKQHAEN